MAVAQTHDDRQSRVAVMGIPRIHLIELLTGRLVLEGIPDDAEIVNISHEPSFNGIVLLLRHESFDVVPMGEMAPMVSWLTVRAKSPEQTPAIKFREFL